MLVILLQLGGIGFVHYNMPLEQQVEAVKSVKQQPAGFEANPIILSPKQELKQIQDIQACVHDFTHRLPCVYAVQLHCCVFTQPCLAVLHCMFALHVFRVSLIIRLYTCSSQGTLSGTVDISSHQANAAIPEACM